MPNKPPSLSDYRTLFRLYDSDSLRRGEVEATEFLFERAVRLLIQPSLFNDRIPTPFREAARQYHEGDKATRQHFHAEDNRQFFLSDLCDFIEMTARGVVGREQH